MNDVIVSKQLESISIIYVAKLSIWINQSFTVDKMQLLFLERPANNMMISILNYKIDF